MQRQRHGNGFTGLRFGFSCALGVLLLLTLASMGTAQPLPPPSPVPPFQQIPFSEIREIIRENQAELDACWDGADPETTVPITFNILPSGDPSSVVAYGGGEVADCVVGVVERMVFPSFDGIDPEPVRFLFGYYSGLTGWPVALF